MYIEENLKNYLTSCRAVLIRGITPTDGMEFLKKYAPDDTTFCGETEHMREILQVLEYHTGDRDSSILVKAGNLSDIHSEQPNLWYFKDAGSLRDDRTVQRYFDMVLDFSNGKILGVSKLRAY